MRRTRLLSALLLAALATGCSATDSAESAGAAPMMAKPERGAAADAEAGGGATQAPKAAQVAQPGVERKLIRTATLSLTVPAIQDAVHAARTIVVGAGGYTGNQQVERSSATITLHVPSDQLDRVVTELSTIGEVTSSAQTAEDVTEQLVDVESRIKTQRASLDRVRALLAQATDIEEIVRVESEVTRREADLESLLKRRETLSGQVAVSTVTISLRESRNGPAPVEPEDEGLGAAFKDGWSAFTGAVGAVLEALARMLPFLAVLAAVGALVWVRWLRPRRGRFQERVARELPQEG